MRKQHRKVRTGCTECRRRRVKCDERRPECQNCNRNKLHCSLLFLTPSSYASLGKTPVVIISSRKPSRRACIPPPSTSFNSLGFSSLDARDQELLHHYTSVVHKTMTSNHVIEILGTEIHRMTLIHPFLLRGTLAVSALHLSSLVPTRFEELSAIAIKEKNAALPSFRAALAEITSNNIHAVFAFSSTVIPYIMASTLTDKKTTARIPTRGDTNPHWFLAIRGLTSILENSWDILRTGPYAPFLLQRRIIRDTSGNPTDVDLAKILPLLDQAPSPISAICHQALEELRRVFSLPFSVCKSWLDAKAAVYIWPGVISSGFVGLVYDRRPEALIILAHYCVLLKEVNSCWYMKGIGVALLEAIEEELHDEWTPWIQWAKEQPLKGLDILSID